MKLKTPNVRIQDLKPDEKAVVMAVIQEFLVETKLLEKLKIDTNLSPDDSLSAILQIFNAGLLRIVYFKDKNAYSIEIYDSDEDDYFLLLKEEE